MIILRLQGLPWSATAKDVRQHFAGLSIPDGGVHIIGGEEGDVFIAFSSDDDARKAFQRQKQPLNGSRIMLLLSSKAEMQEVIAESRAAAQAAKPDPFGTGDVAPSPVPQTNPTQGLLSREGSVSSSHSQSYSGFSQGDDQRRQASRYGDQTSNVNVPGQSLSSQGYDSSYPPSSQSDERSSYGQSQNQMYGSRLDGNDRFKDESLQRGDNNQGLMYKESNQSQPFGSQDRNLGMQRREDQDMGYRESNQYKRPSGFDGQQGRMPAGNMEGQQYQSVTYGSALGRFSSDRDMGFPDSQGNKPRSILQSSGMINPDEGGYQEQFEDPMEGISTSYPPAGPADQSIDEDQRGGGLNKSGDMDTYSGLSQPMSTYGRQNVNKEADKGRYINTQYGDSYWTSSSSADTRAESMMERKQEDTNPFGNKPNRPYTDIQNKPFPDNQNRSFSDNMPYSDNQNRSFSSNQNKPFPDMENRPYSDNQIRPFDNQNKPFPDNMPYTDNQNRSFSDSQNRPFTNMLDRPYSDNQNRSFPDNQNRSFLDSQSKQFSVIENQPFSDNRSKPFPGDRSMPMVEGGGENYQNQRLAANEPRGNYLENYGTNLRDHDGFYSEKDIQREHFDKTRPESTGSSGQQDYRSRDRFGDSSNQASLLNQDSLMGSGIGEQRSSVPQAYGSRMNQELPMASAPAMFDQPPDDPLYSSNMESMDSSHDDFYAVRLTGLPFRTTERDVRMFLRDINIAPDGMQIHRDPQGNLTGTANVRLQGPNDIDQALKRHQQYIGNRYIDVRPCLKLEWEKEKEKDVQTAESSRRRSRSPVRNKRSPLRNCNTCIEIRGLPSSSKNSEIVDFFQGLPMRQDSIYFDPTKDGPSSGVAYVEFVDSDVARKACQKNGRQFNRRTVGIRIISKEIMEAKVTSEMKRRAGRRSPGKRSPDRRRGSSPYNRRGRSPGRRGRSPVKGSSRSSPGRNGPGRRQASPSRRDRDRDRDRDRESSSRQSRRAQSPGRQSSQDRKDSTTDKKERKEIDSRDVRSVSKGEEGKTRGSPKIEDKDRLQKSETSKNTPPKSLLPSPDLGKVQQEKGKEQGLLKTPDNSANKTVSGLGQKETSSKTTRPQQDTPKLGEKSDGTKAPAVIDFHAIRDAVSRFSKDTTESRPNPNEGIGVPDASQRQTEMSGGFRGDNENRGQMDMQRKSFGNAHGGPGDKMQSNPAGIHHGPFGGPRDNRQAAPLDMQQGPFNGPGENKQLGRMDMTHGPPGNTQGGPRDEMQGHPMDTQQGPFHGPGDNRRPGLMNVTHGPPGSTHSGPKEIMQGGPINMHAGPGDSMQAGAIDRQPGSFDAPRDIRRDGPMNMQAGQFGGPGNRRDGSLDRQPGSFGGPSESRQDRQMDMGGGPLGGPGDNRPDRSMDRQHGPFGELREDRGDGPIDMQGGPFGGPGENRRGGPMDMQGGPFDGPGDRQVGPMDIQGRPFGGPRDNRQVGPMDMHHGPFDGPGDQRRGGLLDVQGGQFDAPGENRRGGPFDGPGDNRGDGPFGGQGDSHQGGPLDGPRGNRQGRPFDGPGDNRRGGPMNMQGGPFGHPADNRRGGPFDGPGDNHQGGPIDMPASSFGGPGGNRGDGLRDMQGGPLGGPNDNPRDGPMGSRQGSGMPFQQERMQESRHEGPRPGRHMEDRGQPNDRWQPNQMKGRDDSRDFRERQHNDEGIHPLMEDSARGPHHSGERRTLLESAHDAHDRDRDIDSRVRGFSDRHDRDRRNDREPDGRNRRESSPRQWTNEQSNDRRSRGGFDGPDDHSFNRNGPGSRNSGRDSFSGDRRNTSLDRGEGERMRQDVQGPRDSWMGEQHGPPDRTDRRSLDRGIHGGREQSFETDQGPRGRPQNEGDSEYVCAHIRNVPYTARWPDIAQFFSGLHIIPGGIHIMVNKDGRASGHCFIEFADAHNARLTEERRLQRLDNRALQINACSKAMMIRALEADGEMMQNRPQQFGGRGRGRGSFGPRGPRFQGDTQGPFQGPGPYDGRGPRGPPFHGNRPPFREQERMHDERPHGDQRGPHGPLHHERSREEQRGPHDPGHRERSREDQKIPHGPAHLERSREDQKRPHGPANPERSRDDQRRPHSPHTERHEDKQEQKKPDPPKKSSKPELVIRVSPPKAIPESAPAPTPKKPQPEKPKPKETVPDKKEEKPTPAPALTVHADKHKGCVVTATNLPLTITVDAIGDFFKGFSTMKGAIKLDTNEATGKATGQAKIVFTSPSEANRAIKERNNRPLNGRIVRLHVL